MFKTNFQDDAERSFLLLHKPAFNDLLDAQPKALWHGIPTSSKKLMLEPEIKPFVSLITGRRKIFQALLFAHRIPFLLTLLAAPDTRGHVMGLRLKGQNKPRRSQYLCG